MIVAARAVSLATSDGAWIETPQFTTNKASKETRAKSGASEVQNAVQHPAALTCTFSQLGTQRLATVWEGLVRRLAAVCKPSK